VLLASLQRRPLHAVVGLDEARWQAMDIDALNAYIVERNAILSLQEVRSGLESAHRGVVAALAGMSYDEIVAPYAGYQANEIPPYSERPLIQWVAGNSYLHYEEHGDLIKKLIAD
jgi:hypothetical protein